ncbi:hypothetical protein [Bacillus cereus]
MREINRYDYAYKKLANYQNNSFSSSMNYINCMVKEINPQSPIYNRMEDLTEMLQLYTSQPALFEHVRKCVYNDTKSSIEVVQEVRKHLKRVHYGILNGIKQNVLHEQVISK